ncbi:MAG: hypothetical protein L3J89_09850 [Gammaproteobacteria bacterium]|nr:hypothetical protein [Gammaproteobacteria bacterium]
MDYIETYRGNQACEVYFFSGWATYSHPVKPIGPLDLEHSLSRDSYYRAWLCKRGDKELFVLFEAVEMDKKLTTIPKSSVQKPSINIYKYDGSNSSELGEELSLNDILKYESFLISLPDDLLYLTYVEQKIVQSFEYKYDIDGNLKKVIIMDFDRNIRELNY